MPSHYPILITRSVLLSLLIDEAVKQSFTQGYTASNYATWIWTQAFFPSQVCDFAISLHDNAFLSPSCNRLGFLRHGVTPILFSLLLPYWTCRVTVLFSLVVNLPRSAPFFFSFLASWSCFLYWWVILVPCSVLEMLFATYAVIHLKLVCLSHLCAPLLVLLFIHFAVALVCFLPSDTPSHVLSAYVIPCACALGVCEVVFTLLTTA